MIEYEGRELNIKKIFGYCLSKWYIVVLIFALGGLLLGGLKYYKDMDEYNASVNTEVPESVSVDDAAKAVQLNFSLQEQSDVEVAVEYYKQINDYKEYLQNSIFVNLDPNSVTKRIYLYKIELEDVDKYSADQIELMVADVINMYTTYLDTGVLVDKIVDESGIEARYIEELLLDARVENSTCFRIVVIGADKFDNIDEMVTSVMSEYEDDANSVIYKHSLNLLDSYTSVRYSNEVATKKEEIQTDLYNVTIRLDNLKKKFTDDQQLCYEYATNQISEVEEQVISTSSKPEINYLFIIVGGFVAIFVYFAIVVIRFVYSSYVISESDFTDMLALKYIGLLYDKQSVNKVSTLDKIEYGKKLNREYSESIKYVSVKLKKLCETHDTDKLAIVSSDFNIVNESILQNVCKEMKNYNIEIILVDDVLENSDSLKKLLDTRYCIFAECIGKTLVDNVKSLKNLCKDNNVNVLGVIDIKG